MKTRNIAHKMIAVDPSFEDGCLGSNGVAECDAASPQTAEIPEGSLRSTPTAPAIPND